jgi:CheY-like chemotaxis protein
MSSGKMRPVAVLIVDDYRDAADSLALLLRHEGYDVRAAYDGPHALTLLNGWQPEVVFLDLLMPDMDGYGLAQQLCDGSRRRPLLVAITGRGRDQDYERTRAAGFDRHFVKPVDPDVLFALLLDYAARTNGEGPGAAGSPRPLAGADGLNRPASSR